MVKKQKLILSEFMKEYFLDEVPISLLVGDKRVNVASYKVDY